MKCYNKTCAWIHNQRCENTDAIIWNNCTGRVKKAVVVTTVKSMAKDKTPPYKDALELWGEDSQFGMMFEESAELIEQVAKYQKALNQYRRGRIDLQELVEELIDTEIMLQEMKVVLQETTGEDVEALCKEMWKKKVAKFQSQVDAEKEKRGI